MPSLSGGTNRAFPTSKARLNNSSYGAPGKPRVITTKFPDGNDLLAAGATRTGRSAVQMEATELQADIPEGVTAYFEVDGLRIHETSDGQGSVGTLKLGDAAAGIGLKVNQVVASFTNTTGASLNCRYWLTGFNR